MFYDRSLIPFSKQVIDAGEHYLRELSIARHKAQSEGTNAAGAVLVPTEVADQIILIRNMAGRIRRAIRVEPMGSDVATFPRSLTDTATGYFTENSTITGTDPTFDSISCTAAKLGALTLHSTEVIEDGIEQTVSGFIRSAAYAVAKQEDSTGYNGDGTSAHAGMRGLTTLLTDANHTASAFTATGHVNAGAITATDLASVMALCPDWAMENAAWHCSSYFFATVFAALGATSGMVVGPLGNLEKVLSFSGFPVITTSQLPTSGTQTGKTLALFGDMSMTSVLAERRELRIRMLKERFADADQIGMQITERLAINHYELGSTSSAGGMIALVAG